VTSTYGLLDDAELLELHAQGGIISVPSKAAASRVSEGLL
jgi:hypothetical protein